MSNKLINRLVKKDEYNNLSNTIKSMKQNLCSIMDLYKSNRLTRLAKDTMIYQLSKELLTFYNNNQETIKNNAKLQKAVNKLTADINEVSRDIVVNI